MSKIGNGYGSQWHLNWYLHAQREVLDQAAGNAVGGKAVDWNLRGGGEEWKGLDFLADDLPAKTEWKTFWPQTGEVQNWDAVGWVRVGNSIDLLLVEAKAHSGECKTRCCAKEHGGLPAIRKAFCKTKGSLGIGGSVDHWLRPYYQYCNRLAALDFLMRHSISAHLLFIYFCGAVHKGKKCPASEAEWRPHIDELICHLGLRRQSPLEKRVHELFLPARGQQQIPTGA